MFADNPDKALGLIAQLSQATDQSLAQLAKRLAGRLVLEVARTGPITKRGVAKLGLGPADGGGDIDIDASMDAIIDAKARSQGASLEDLKATRWEKPGTAICLLVDQSGSMDGQRLASATLAAAMCSWRAPAEFAVLAFNDRVIEIKGLNRSRPASAVVGDVLGLRGRGTTDVALALVAARRQLDSSSAARRITILLSDAEVTTGADPTAAARALDELIILAPADEPEHGEALAAKAGATMATVDGPMSVLSAMTDLLS